MSVLVAFLIFLLAVVICMLTGQALGWALLLGFFCFFFLAVHKGFAPLDVLRMAGDGMRTVLMVTRFFVLIGFLTALWRASGTIAFFVYWGIKIITPHTFLLIAFLLPALLCLAFGSSFGVAGTAGVILMAVARSGGANELLTAAAAMSGCYFGERLSPASSAAALNAAACGVEQQPLQRRLWRHTFWPLGLTLAVYAVLAWMFPLQQVDENVLRALEEGFNLSWPMVLPAVLLLALPLFKVRAVTSITLSCLLAAVLACTLQGQALPDLLMTCIVGHTVAQPGLREILSGGGLVSFASSFPVVLLSTAYSGIFSGTGLLDPVKSQLERVAGRIGLLPTECVLSFVLAALFCNQAVVIVMSAQLTDGFYEKSERGRLAQAVDIGDCALNIPGLVPWAIASSVPLAMMGSSFAALPFAVYLYLVPLCRIAHELRAQRRMRTAERPVS